MLEREPNRYDELNKIHEAAREQAKQQAAREQEAPLQVGKATNDLEAHMAALERELDARVKIGQLTQSEKIDLLRREENRALSDIQARGVSEFPKPVVDPERLLTDPEYRREVVRKEREERQIARNGARPELQKNRSDSEGRRH
jgi:hypothetical protein